ncbi:MAG: type II secretion system protein [Clostridia bacterium]|nr:type II secretion system protein [Clostridia bacterium]
MANLKSKTIKQEKNNKGITLIALVITIIVLLILAGVSIATLTGENGILNKSTSAKQDKEQQEGKELIKLAINEMMIEKKEKGENLTIDFIGDHIHEKLKIDKEDVTKNGEPVETVNVIYGKYEYEIDDVFNLSIIGSIKGKITINATYKILEKNAVITITVKTEDEKGIKRILLPNNEYEDGNNQKEITIEYMANKNGDYKFIAEGNNNSIRAKTIKISEIDTLSPNEAQIALTSTRINVGESVTATVIVSDDQSGINLNHCFWILNSSSEEIGIDSDQWENATKLNDLQSTFSLSSTTIGKKYLHVLSCDNFDNQKETISEGILFVGEQKYLNIPKTENNWIFNLPIDWSKSRIQAS